MWGCACKLSFLFSHVLWRPCRCTSTSVLTTWPAWVASANSLLMFFGSATPDSSMMMRSYMYLWGWAVSMQRAFDKKLVRSNLMGWCGHTHVCPGAILGASVHATAAVRLMLVRLDSMMMRTGWREGVRRRKEGGKRKEEGGSRRRRRESDSEGGRQAGREGERERGGEGRIRMQREGGRGKIHPLRIASLMSCWMDCRSSSEALQHAHPGRARLRTLSLGAVGSELLERE